MHVFCEMQFVSHCYTVVIDIDIEDLFTVEYYKPFNISSVALFLDKPV